MRGKRSISAIMVDEILSGAKEAGAQTDHIILRKKKINRCLGCLSCWIKTPGRCIQKDDMNDLLDIYMSSDIVIYACPVYVENVPGLIKDFMDRLIPITDPHFELDEKGVTRHVKRYEKYPGTVVVANGGFIEQSAFDVFRLLFKRITRSLNSKLVAEIYKGGGGMIGLDNPALAPMVKEYKALLKKAGEEIALDMKLSKATMAALDKQMIPTDVYNQQVNLLWDGLIKKQNKKEKE